MPERFEIYIVYKRRYINTLPFLYPFTITNFVIWNYTTSGEVSKSRPLAFTQVLSSQTACPFLGIGVGAGYWFQLYLKVLLWDWEGQSRLKVIPEKNG